MAKKWRDQINIANFCLFWPINKEKWERSTKKNINLQMKLEEYIDDKGPLKLWPHKKGLL